MNEDGGMWDHFVPVWEELRATKFPPVLVGGYGLFLKQKWVHNGGDPSNPAVLGPDRWNNDLPRVTNDYDMAVDVDMIKPAPEEDDPQKEIVGILHKNGFKYEHEALLKIKVKLDPEKKCRLSFDHHPTDDEIWAKLAEEHPDIDYSNEDDWSVEVSKEKWRWIKHVAGKKISLDADFKTEFMSVGFREKPSGVRQGPKRMRRRNSRKNLIETHLHEELKGWEVAAEGQFTFQLKGVDVVVPNPLTWAVMKLNAASEKRAQATRSDEEWVNAYGYDSSPEETTLDRLEGLAEKHAGDLWRIVALATLREADGITDELKDAVREGKKYAAAKAALHEHFLAEDGYGVQVAKSPTRPNGPPHWEEEDITVMQQVLKRWFG